MKHGFRARLTPSWTSRSRLAQAMNYETVHVISAGRDLIISQEKYDELKASGRVVTNDGGVSALNGATVRVSAFLPIVRMKIGNRKGRRRSRKNRAMWTAVRKYTNTGVGSPLTVGGWLVGYDAGSQER